MLMLYIQDNNFSVMFGLKQYKAEEKVFCSRTQLKASGEFQTVDPLISSPVIYHWFITLKVIQVVKYPSKSTKYILPKSQEHILPCNYQLSKSIVHEIKIGDTAVM